MEFIAQAKGPKYSLHAAVYEFTHEPAIQAFVDALERGADVKIVHHGKRKNQYVLKQNYDAETVTSFTKKTKNNKEVADGSKKNLTFKNRQGIKKVSRDAVCQATVNAVSNVGLRKPADPKDAAKLLKAFDTMMIERTITQISHNKFIVLLKDGKPIQVWTGSTNFTGGGIYGQTNVGPYDLKGIVAVNGSHASVSPGGDSIVAKYNSIEPTMAVFYPLIESCFNPSQ